MPKTSIKFVRVHCELASSRVDRPVRREVRLIGAFVMFLSSLLVMMSFSTTAWSANEESIGYFQEAQKAIKDGNAKEAIIHLKNAVRADPDNIDARLMLGQFNIQRGDLAGAEKEFREARNRGMADEKVLSLLGQSMLIQGKAKELLAEIPADTLKGVNKITAHILRARAYLALNDVPNAQKELDIARPDSLENAQFHTADAEFLQRQGDYPAAEKAADRAIAIDPKYGLALWLKGELRRAQKDLPGSLEAYNKALEIDKNSMQVLLGRAYVYLGLNRPEEAEADADAILKRVPQMPMALYIKAVLQSQRGETEKALQTLQPVEFRMAAFMPAVFLLANLNLKLDRLEGAMSYAKRYQAANENRPEAIKLLAAVYLRQKNYPEAVKILQPYEEVEEFKKDTVYLQLLGNSYLASSNYTAAAGVFKTLQKLNPDDANVREQLAITSLGLGEQDDGVRELEAMTEGEGGSDRVNLLLIITHLRNKEFVKAEEAALNYVKHREDSAMAHNLLGSVYLAQNKRTEARAAFDTALKKDASFSPAVLNLSQLERMENQRDKAKSLLTEYLKNNKPNERVLTQLAEISIAEKDMEGALALLQQAVDSDPKSQTARLRLVEMQVRLEKNETALQTASELAAMAPESPSALNALAQVQILNKQLASGISTYRKLVSIAPKAPMGQLLLGRALLMNKNVAEAKTAFDTAISLAPNMPDARAERIGAEMSDSGVDAAIKLAEKYRDEKPENPLFHVLLGDVYMRGEKFSEAGASFEKAHQLQPSGNVFRRLYVAQVRSGKQDEAFKLLQEWVKKTPDDWETRLVYSTELIRRGNTEQAILENEALNEKLPGRPLILNNLGWLYSRKGDPRGLELVRTAHELAPKAPEIQDTYGWMLVKEKKLDEGLKLLDSAAKALPESAEVQYHFAAALAESGKKIEARDILTRILADKSEFDERKDAEALLQTLKAG